MSPDKAANERAVLVVQLRFHRLVNIGLLGCLFVGLVLLSFVVVRDPVRIVPPEVRHAYEIGARHANKDYLLDMADYVLSEVLTVTPETIDHNIKTILRMTHPDGFGTLKATLDAAALRMKQERVTTIWVPRDADVHDDAQQVVVRGHLKTYIADKLTSQRDKTYAVTFTVTISGRLYVSTIAEVLPDDATHAGLDRDAAHV